jgi:threonine dehydratase
VKAAKQCSASTYQSIQEGNVPFERRAVQVIYPSHPSSFIELHSVIHPRAVTEFLYRYTSSERAHVLLSFKLSSTNQQQEVSEVLSTLEKQGMQGYDISDDEMAKSHVRYMIGGCLKVPNERI